MTRGFDDTEYRALLAHFPPRPIEDEDELLNVEERISQLLSQEQRTPAEEAYLTLLGALVERWESDHVDIPPLGATQLVKTLLVERGLRQKDLAGSTWRPPRRSRCGWWTTSPSNCWQASPNSNARRSASA